VSEEKYRTLVDEVNDGFYMTDEAGDFTSPTPPWPACMALRILRHWWVGNSWISSHLRCLRDSARHNITRCIVDSLRKSSMARSCDRDGTRAFLEVKPVSIVNGDKIIGSRGVVRDVTARKHTEDALLSLSGISQSIRKFVVGISQASPDGG